MGQKDRAEVVNRKVKETMMKLVGGKTILKVVVLALLSLLKISN